MSKLAVELDIDAEAHRILDAWLARIHQTNCGFRSEVGLLKFSALGLASHFLAAPRSVRKMLAPKSRQARPVLQCPWMPYWPALTARPLHNSSDFAWTTVLRQASSDIRNELLEVRASFERARYDSEFNEKPWHTYYFFLHGRPDVAHLAACPRTCEVLEQVPHNGFHVCFSVLEPGGSLHPHTGPTNGSLTAHLGLLNCAGTSLWVGGEKGRYLDDEVLVFDDSFVHWVDNAGTKQRYTLMITFWHPELTVLERELLRWVVRMGVRD
jgi:aspartyl/asparaginyl beta-hydroxylase (cupin superfamily)